MGKASKRKKVRRELDIVAPEIVGYVGFLRVGEVLRKDGGYVVAGSAGAMDDYVKAELPSLFGKHCVTALDFEKVLHGIDQGQIYSFDEGAFNRFRVLLKRIGMGSELGDFRRHCSVGSNFALVGGLNSPDPEFCSVISEDEALDKIFGSGDTLPLTDELIKELLNREGNKFSEEDLLGARKVGMEYCPSRNSLILVGPLGDLDAF